MFRDALLLIRVYWRIDLREGKGLPLAARLGAIAIGIMAGVFSAIVGYAAGSIVVHSDLPFRLQEAMLPGLLLTVMIVALLFTGFHHALQALYLSGDMERLLVAPIRAQSVLLAKLLARLPSLAQYTFLLVVPALFAYGVGIRSGPLYYVGSLLVVLGAPLFGLSVGAIISMWLVRLIPARRLSEHIGAAYIVIGMLVAVGIRIPFFFSDQSDPDLDAEAIVAVQSLLSTLEQTPLPTFWAGRGLVDLGQGMIGSGSGQLIAYILSTFGLFALTVMLAPRLYLTGWLRMQGAGLRKEALSEEPGTFGRRSLDSAIAIKDWLLRIRDSRQVATLFTQVIAALFILFILVRPSADDSPFTIAQGGDLPSDAWWILALFSPGVVVSGMLLMVGWSIFFQAARVSLALEGKAFYILKVAPISARQVLRGKALGILAPYALLSMAALLGSWFFVRFSLLWMPYAWLCLLLIGGGMLTLATAMGFPWVNLDWDDPRRMGSRRGNLYSILSSLMFGLIGSMIAVLAFGLSIRAPAWSFFYSLLAILILVGIFVAAVDWAARIVEAAWADLGVTESAPPAGPARKWWRRLTRKQ